MPRAILQFQAIDEKGALFAMETLRRFVADIVPRPACPSEARISVSQAGAARLRAARQALAKPHALRRGGRLRTGRLSNWILSHFTAGDLAQRFVAARASAGLGADQMRNSGWRTMTFSSACHRLEALAQRLCRRPARFFRRQIVPRLPARGRRESAPAGQARHDWSRSGKRLPPTPSAGAEGVRTGRLSTGQSPFRSGGWQGVSLRTWQGVRSAVVIAPWVGRAFGMRVRRGRGTTPGRRRPGLRRGRRCAS